MMVSFGVPPQDFQCPHLATPMQHFWRRHWLGPRYLGLDHLVTPWHSTAAALRSLRGWIKCGAHILHPSGSDSLWNFNFNHKFLLFLRCHCWLPASQCALTPVPAGGSGHCTPSSRGCSHHHPSCQTPV